MWREQLPTGVEKGFSEEANGISSEKVFALRERITCSRQNVMCKNMICKGPDYPGNTTVERTWSKDCTGERSFDQFKLLNHLLRDLSVSNKEWELPVYRLPFRNSKFL